MNYKSKLKLAKRMMSNDEIEDGCSPFDSSSWKEWEKMGTEIIF